MENKNVVGPAGGNYGLRIQADKNVKKLTVKYANKSPVNKNKTPAPPLSTLWLFRVFLPVAVTPSLKKYTHIYIYHMYCLLKSLVKIAQGRKGTEEDGKARDN